MAKKIIVLDQLDHVEGRAGETITLKVCLWASVPVGREASYADATFSSEYRDATTAEKDALKAGSVVERVLTKEWVPGTEDSVIDADLVAVFNAFQAEIDAKNVTKRYGTSWDGTLWSRAGTV